MLWAVWRTVWPLAVGVALLAAGRRCRSQRAALVVLAVGVAAAAISTAGAVDDRWYYLLSPRWAPLDGTMLVAGWSVMFLLGLWSARSPAAGRWWASLAVVVVGYLLVASRGPCAAYWAWHEASANNYPDAAGRLRQTTPWSCVPAAGAMLLARHGLRVSEGALAARAGTMPTVGTSTASMVLVLDGLARRRGLAARGAVLGLDQAQGLRRPFLTAVAHSSNARHCVLVERIEADHVIVTDPLLGRRYTFPKTLWLGMWYHSCVWLEGN